MAELEQKVEVEFAPPEEVPFPEGMTQINDRFAIGEKLAIKNEGAEEDSADIYNGYDANLKQEVAVKLFKPRDEEQYNRALQEARTLAATAEDLRVITVYDVVEYKNENGEKLLAIVMRKKKQEDKLSSRIVKDEVSLEAISAFAHQIGPAIDRLDKAGLHNRDMKPDNFFAEYIWLNSNAYMISYTMTDFGISSEVLEKVPYDSLRGTANYVPPEAILSEEEVDLKSEVYMLGETIYEMTTGEPYTEDLEMMETLVSKIKDQDGLSQEQKELVQERMKDKGMNEEKIESFVDALHKSLMNSQNDRFATGGEFAKALFPEKPPVWYEGKPEDVQGVNIEEVNKADMNRNYYFEDIEDERTNQRVKKMSDGRTMYLYDDDSGISKREEIKSLKKLKELIRENKIS